MKKRNRRGKRSEADSEKAFLMGLKDECPQCGDVLEEFSVEDALKHLRECTDTDKKAKQKAKLEKEAEERQKKEELEAKQREAQNQALNDAEGGGNLWMLTDDQLKEKVEDGQNKTREELIKELVTTGSEVNYMPSNLGFLSTDQLREICICSGLPVSSDREKMIEDINDSRINRHNMLKN